MDNPKEHLRQSSFGPKGSEISYKDLYLLWSSSCLEPYKKFIRFDIHQMDLQAEQNSSTTREDFQNQKKDSLITSIRKTETNSLVASIERPNQQSEVVPDNQDSQLCKPLAFDPFYALCQTKLHQVFLLFKKDKAFNDLLFEICKEEI